MIALAAALAVAAAPASSVTALASRVADAATPLLPPHGARLAVHVEGEPALARAVEAELLGALGGRGYAGTIRAAGEVAAREAGADALLELRVAVSGGRLAGAGSLVSTRENFFTGRAVVAGGALQAAVPADDAARLLSGAAGSAPPRLDELLRAPAPVLAVAAGDLDGSAPDELAVLTFDRVIVQRGEMRIAWDLPPRDPGARASRDPVGGLAIRGGEILWSVPSRGGGGKLRLDRGALRVSGALPALPLASGDAGLLTGSAVPGRNLISPELRLARSAEDPAPRAGTAPAPLLGASVAPHAAALGVVTSDLEFVRIDPDLRPSGAPLAGVGAAALADVDGDGAVELVASGTSAEAPDTVRVLRGSGDPLLTATVEGTLTCAAAGDLDGDGRDDAVLGGATASGEGLVVVVHAGPAR